MYPLKCCSLNIYEILSPFLFALKFGDRINQRDNFSKGKYNRCCQNYIKALSITFLMRKKKKVYVYRTEMFKLQPFLKTIECIYKYLHVYVSFVSECYKLVAKSQ